MGVEVAPMGVVLSKQDGGRSGDDGSDRGISLKTKLRELLPRQLAVRTRDEEARDVNMSKQGMHVVDGKECDLVRSPFQGRKAIMFVEEKED